MISRNMTINIVFTATTVLICFGLAKLLLFCAGFGFVVDQQTKTVTTGLFLLGGFLCSLRIIHKN